MSLAPPPIPSTRGHDPGASSILGLVFAFMLGILVVLGLMGTSLDSVDRIQAGTNDARLDQAGQVVAGAIHRVVAAALDAPNATSTTLVDLPEPSGGFDYSGTFVVDNVPAAPGCKKVAVLWLVDHEGGNEARLRLGNVTNAGVGSGTACLEVSGSFEGSHGRVLVSYIGRSSPPTVQVQGAPLGPG